MKTAVSETSTTNKFPFSNTYYENNETKFHFAEWQYWDECSNGPIKAKRASGNWYHLCKSKSIHDEKLSFISFYEIASPSNCRSIRTGDILSS